MKMVEHEHQGNALKIERFPRSNSYDLKWILDNQMGLNPLWLTEWVCEKMPLVPGMRVLDLGCGKGLSSVFLVKEYDVQVWAVDLWIQPTDGWKLWLEWKKARARVEGESPSVTSDIQVLEADRGRFMGFVRMVARRKTNELVKTADE